MAASSAPVSRGARAYFSDTSGTDTDNTSSVAAMTSEPVPDSPSTLPSASHGPNSGVAAAAAQAARRRERVPGPSRTEGDDSSSGSSDEVGTRRGASRVPRSGDADGSRVVRRVGAGGTSASDADADEEDEDDGAAEIDAAVDAAASAGCSGALAAFEAVLGVLTAAGCIIVVLVLRQAAATAVLQPLGRLLIGALGEEVAMAASVAMTQPWLVHGVGAVAAVAIDLVGVLALLAWRYSGYFGVSMRVFLARLRLGAFHVSAFARRMIAYHVAGMLVLLLMQVTIVDWFFALDNFMAEDASIVSGTEGVGGGDGESVGSSDVVESGSAAADAVVTGAGTVFNYGRALELVVASPVREEFVFRVIVFYAAFVRYPSVPVSACIANVLFATVHLLNAYSLRYGALYVALQVAVGFIVGVFYSLRFAVTGSVWEVIVLHVVNNIGAAFVPADGSVDYLELRVLLPRECCCATGARAGQVDLPRPWRAAQPSLTVSRACC